MFFGFSALAGLTGCEPADLGIQLTPDDGTRTVTIGVSAETSATKAEIGDDLVFSWTAGDQIAVWAGSEGSGQYYTSEAYAGGNTFSVNLAGTRSNYAVYPAGIEVSDAATASSLKVKLPDVYDFTAAGADYSPLPMVAVNTEGHDLAFYHLGGLLRITLGDLPAGTSYVTVDLGKPINGIFPVHLESDGSYIVNTDEITGGSNVTKFLVPSPASGSIVLNLPVPTGSYESITVTAYDASDNSLGADSPAFSWNCERAYGKKLADNDLGWVYVFGSLTDGTVPYSGGDASLATEFKSYRYRGTEVEEVPYVVEYSLDGETWRTEAPDWLTGAPTSSTGSIDGEDLGLSVAPQVNSAPDPHHNILSVREAKTDFDLSTVNVATGELVSRSTANCYVVQAPGTYMFPLVYGNGVKNGAVNESAYRAKAGVDATEYRPDDGEEGFLGRYKDHLDQNITSPYIATQQSGKTLSATLIWTDVLGLVTDVALSGSGEDSYLTFSVPAETITQGNALVAVLVDDDVDGTPETIAWSWHIWVTEEDLTAVKEGSNGYMFAPVNIGWCEGKTETYVKRSYQVRAVQNATENTSTVIITENAGSIITGGNNPYYQWGRKDPIQASDGTTNHSAPDYVDKVYYPSSSTYTPNNNATSPQTLGYATQHPYEAFVNPNYNWCAQRFDNLWSSTIYQATNPTVPNFVATLTPTNSQMINGKTKTIYDPSPVGFRVPTLDAWSTFTTTNFIWDVDKKGRFFNDSDLFFPAAGNRNNVYLDDVGKEGLYHSTISSSAIPGPSSFTLNFDRSNSSLSLRVSYSAFFVVSASVRPVVDN